MRDNKKEPFDKIISGIQVKCLLHNEHKDKNSRISH